MRLKNIRNFLSATLVALLGSIILTTGTVNAQETNKPLLENPTVLQEAKQKVDEKFADLQEIQNETLSVSDRREKLDTEVEELKSLIAELNQLVKDKKAQEAEEARRAEAERIRIEEEKTRVAELQSSFVNPVVFAANSAGNTYTAGNCTWYAKSRRPDLPNNLGNAKTWYSRAAAQGFSVGSAPKKGAIGVSFGGYYGHVVYVEGVNPDGTVTISDMNYRGLYSITTRTVNASQFSYIYEL